MDVTDQKSPLTPDGLIQDLISFTEENCSSCFLDFQERLESESIEYGVSEETLTEIFLANSSETRIRMLPWFVIANLAVASVYFLGRHDKNWVRQALQELKLSVLQRFGGVLGDDACHPLETVTRIMREGIFDAYEAGALAFLTEIGYLDHPDSTSATLDPNFLKKIRLDFSRTIPFLHDAGPLLK